jgi:Asp-tRNA(Asn)/Glu-tRNA(Gln) amidotransferase A subunit family amidase
MTGKQSAKMLSQTRRNYLRSIAGGTALFGITGSGAVYADTGGKQDNLRFTPVTVLAERIRTGELSPVDLVETVLDRIQERDDDVNAFVTLTPDRARKAAHEAERAVERGDDLGPLHGVPFAVKDTHSVEGVRYTAGVLPFADRIVDKTNPFEQKFIDAGAIVIGTTNVPEFGHMGKTDNLIQGPTSTPFDLGRNAGGSSGGSAAAVADGLVPFATGADAGGSIRIPASFTGTYGLFPAPENPGAFGTSSTFVQSGVQTRSVADTAFLLSIAKDDKTEYLGALNNDVGGMSIGYDLTPGGWPVDARVRSIVGEKVDTITGAGASVEEIDVDLLGTSYEELVKAMTILWSGGYVVPKAKDLEQYGLQVTGEDSDCFTDAFVSRVKEGKQFTKPDGDLTDDALLTAVNARTRAFNGFQNALEDHDLLVVPTVSVPPFSNDILGPATVDGVDTHPVYGWIITAMFNMTGLPAASVPAGLTDDGLPVGMQIVGPPLDTESVITASVAYEQVNPWHDTYQ